MRDIAGIMDQWNVKNEAAVDYLTEEQEESERIMDQK